MNDIEAGRAADGAGADKPTGSEPPEQAPSQSGEREGVRSEPASGELATTEVQEILPHQPTLPFFIVGIGASAGGLEALRDFFSSVEAGISVSYVVIQHLSPDFKSMMVQLLSQHTSLKVKEVVDGAAPEVDCVHLIPPKRVLTLKDGKFSLVEREPARIPLPINVFLESLAAEQGDQSAAVILSGTGTDGTHGARIMREAGGLITAQEPSSAKFDGMPSSVISSGLADFVATPPKLAKKMANYVSHPMLTKGTEAPEVSERQALSEILSILKTQSTIDFFCYKEGTVVRRIQRRASLTGESSLADYLRVVRRDSVEVEILTRELLIGVTQFFRDEHAWRTLSEVVIPQLVDAAEERSTLRLWVAGCATGEEAYSMAMLLEEHLAKSGKLLSYRLFATDVRRDSLRFARAGVYPAAACTSIPEAMREKYFEASGENLIAKRRLRDSVTFAPHDLLSDPPFTQLSLVSCRNMLIYVNADAQRRAIARMRLALKEGGYLFLGSSESVGESANAHFRSVNAKGNFFVARGTGHVATALLGTPLRGRSMADAEGALARSPKSAETIYQTVIERYVPPGVAVDSNFELLQVFGRVDDFVRVPPGRVTVSLLKMVAQPLSVLLNSAGRKALSQGSEVSIPGVRIPMGSGERTISVRILPVDDLPAVTLGLLIFFEQVDEKPVPEDASLGDVGAATQQRIRELEDELLVARENLHSAVQDLEATNEELQATNEELTASNEELQSTNEELQSVNEELYTVNSEYQQKINELEELNSDLENLLRAVDAGVLFLDEDLTIRRFNQSSTQLLPLRSEDIGRPLQEIAIQADYPDFCAHAAAVQTTSAPQTTAVQGTDGAWWSICIRVFSNTSGAHRGVIVTMQDISDLRQAITELSRTQRAHDLAEGISGGGHAIVDFRRENVVFSAGARELLGMSAQTQPLSSAWNLFGTEQRQEAQQALEAVRAGADAPFTVVRTIQTRAGKNLHLRITVQAKTDPQTDDKLLFAVFQPVPIAPE